MLRIHQALQAGGFPNASKLAREAEVSTKTIHRDVEFMRDRLNLPIEYDARRNGYHYTGEVSGFPTMFVIGRDGKISEIVSGGGPGEDYRLEYALARAGVKVDLASIPPEPKKDPNAPKSIPAMMKTPAMAATCLPSY